MYALVQWSKFAAKQQKKTNKTTETKGKETVQKQGRNEHTSRLPYYRKIMARKTRRLLYMLCTSVTYNHVRLQL